MSKKILEEKSFIGFEYLPAEPITDSIKIYHPFASLANEYFSNRGFDVISLKCGAIEISFKNLTRIKKMELAEEIKDFLKSSRQKVIKDFLIYKKWY